MTLGYLSLFWMVAAPVAFAAKTGLTPTERVIQMLQDLKAEVEQDGAAEERTYLEYETFCNKTEADKTEAIELGEDNEEQYDAALVQKTSAYEETMAEIKERKAKGEALESELQASKRQCVKDKNTFDANDADLGAAVVGLESAIEKLDAANDTGAAAAGAGALLQFGSALEESLNLAEAMGFLTGPKRSAVSSLLQTGKAEPWLEEEGAEHNKQEYEFQSGGIVATLQDLLTQFRDERSSVQEEWEKTQAACSDFETTKTDEIKENEDALSSAQTTASTLKGEMADAKESLLTTRKTLKEDRTYLAELQKNCAARKADFAQRSTARASEMQALEQASNVMEDKVADIDTAVNGEMANTSFIQESMSHSRQHQGGAHVVRETQGSEATATMKARSRLNVALQAKAAGLLAETGGRIASSRLSGLAVRIQHAEEPGNLAADPLAEVKRMVQGLVSDLLKEAEAEATQKGFCDSTMGKARTERDRRFREAKKISAKVGGLDTKRSELIEEIDLLTEDIAKLQQDLSEATQLRTDESAENLETIRQSKEGFEAVKDAIVALSDFYKGVARKAKAYDITTSFVQLSASKAKEEPEAEPEAGFQGSYGGKQNAGLGVITLMEVIRDDFERTYLDTKKSEAKASEEFTELKLESKIDISGKETKRTLNQEDLSVTENALNAGKSQLQATFDLLDGALQTMEDLKPQCVDNKMTFEERQAKRQEEMDSLKTALCTLDPENKEPECQAEE